MEEFEKLKYRISELETELAQKDVKIVKLERKIGELESTPIPGVGLEKLGDIEVSSVEHFLIKLLKENSNKMIYRAVQNACEDKFEGVRLILKKMKTKGIVDFEGPVPGFSGEITLLREP